MLSHLVSHGGKHIAVTVIPLPDLRFRVQQVGVWSEVDGQRAYTKLTSPDESFATTEAAQARGLEVARAAIDRGLV